MIDVPVVYRVETDGHPEWFVVFRSIHYGPFNNWDDAKYMSDKLVSIN